MKNKMGEFQKAYNDACKALDIIKNIQARHINGTIEPELLEESHRLREDTSDARAVLTRLVSNLENLAIKGK